MSSRSRVEVIRFRARALPRLGSLVLGFFEIAVELLDQVLDRRRVAFFPGRGYFVVLFDLLPHNGSISALSILLLIRQKALISRALPIRVLQTMDLRRAMCIYLQAARISHSI